MQTKKGSNFRYCLPSKKEDFNFFFNSLDFVKDVDLH